MSKPILAITIAFLVANSAFAAERPTLNGQNDEINYSVGHQVGRDLLRQQVKVNPEILLQGVLDATSGDQALMPYDKMIDTLADLREKIVKRAELQKLDIRNAGEEFLRRNRSEKGVEILSSGLQYKIIQPGTGAKPSAGDRVRVTYSGRDIYGKPFDTTQKQGVSEPVDIEVDKVIPGWGEALKMMPEGAEWELYIPQYLAFKDKGPLAGQAVVYTLKLLKVNP
ncbi:FKBP-type peptidyl-prolyl cis-trans isomerase N-terminal domain-containing protein [Malonomonas rubra]|uniref:FKBP-type peptidyl-prolyl cis-trans isomerase N-terminal domain-containing protein n=1 Tax=Malonomonas rubra TaxID=57040 RepID=UPI0026E96988|nr:FKBP-type peptidyl-prolyl cis-trans isomerase N-terminal domain-containing protein [Malonomonas rubra]